MRKKIFVWSVALLFVATLFNAAPARAQAATMQFYNFETSTYQSDFPWNTSNEIVVHGPGISALLPIDIIFKISGSEVWSGQIPAGTQSCKDDNTCSTRGPDLADPGTVPIEIVALSLTGTTIAVQKSGPEAATTQPASNTVAEPSAPVVTPAPTTTAPTDFGAWWPQFQTWLTWWWLGGFIFGALWIFLWLFVGWQWGHRHFWGFGWPWPWWFWIPWIWFIPWLVIGFTWWLDWWYWWVWIWWLFPWGFWLFWWIIVFKEAKLWMWGQKQ